MAYRFKLQEPPAREISRIGLEQVDVAQARLARKTEIPAAVHDTRRCLKRMRALLRLARPALGERIFRRENKRLAGIGKELAGVRDRHVMLQTLARLESRFGALPNGGGVKLKKLFANGRTPHSRGARVQELRHALAGLELAKTFFARTAHEPIDLSQVIEGMERVYRKARRAFRAAYETPSDEAFHNWRKAVQQHWRHMQLMSRAWPEVLGGRAAEAKELSRLLGDDHDLAVLIAFVAHRGKSALSPGDAAALVQQCRTSQAELRELARPRGERLFVERASDLSARMAHYWTAASRLSSLVPADGSAGQAVKPETPVPKKPARARRPGASAQAASRGLPEAASRRSGR